MSAFTILRSLFFALFIVIHGAILTVASLNLASSSSTGPLRSVDAYLIFYSTLSLLFIFPLIVVDVLRRGALTSRVWFECAWLFVSWIVNLCGAASVTALSPVPSCTLDRLASCSTSEVEIGVTWGATLLVLAQLVLMVVAPMTYSKRYPDVWTASVRDFQWFNGGGSGKSEVLGSRPPSPAFVPRHLSLTTSNPVPRLEQMAAEWQPTPGNQVRAQAMTVTPYSKPVQATKATDEPQPLTFAYAPAIAPSRAPVHYSASATISVGVLPGRRPSKKVTTAAPSLYPTSVQTALHGSPAKRAATAPSIPSSPPHQLPHRVSTTQATYPEEPLPIQNWPRVNPQEPYRKERSGAAQRQLPAQPMSTPGPAPATTSLSTSPSRSSRGPRPRPPPLDLSAASPARLR